tara:strand:+ start:160 stop:477 length:318 start_codon:yes stop_codon:yes gene_type:complete
MTSQSVGADRLCPKTPTPSSIAAIKAIRKTIPPSTIPYKKPKKGKLTKEEKQYNHALSRFRVRVEHTIGRMKKFRILADRFRYPRTRHTVKFSIIAGITNLLAGF